MKSERTRKLKEENEQQLAMLSTTTTKKKMKIKYNSGNSYKIVQWTWLGLNCQLHDCVYFHSVSRVRAFDYVCCFGCWSSLPSRARSMPFYTHIFRIPYKIILLLLLWWFVFVSLPPLPRSRWLGYSHSDSSDVPTVFLEIFFFPIFCSFATRFCIIAFSCAERRLNAYAVSSLSLSLSFSLSTQNLYDLLSIGQWPVMMIK